jgi:Uma2 family endonuclease
MSTAVLPPLAELPLGIKDESHFEIIDGVPREKPATVFFANILASFLANSINTFALPKRLGMAVNETAYQREPKNSRRPDVSYFELAKFPAREILVQDPPVAECEPNLAIEIVSPSNTITEMSRRIAHFFKTGVQLVWVVLPESRQVYVYRSTKDCTILEMGDTLDGDGVLPGYSLTLSELFNLPSLFS